MIYNIAFYIADVRRCSWMNIGLRFGPCARAKQQYIEDQTIDSNIVQTYEERKKATLANVNVSNRHPK